ncbi:LOB domain-containing protein 1-like [Phalaenopsis equestris]|uniref:LOB domain-containing protein 1-like n=1 Tax=Phalaenopsis equestris TaxID=78828 RepID=UPI0009E2BC21|nr:LOB domain-containing protein 1-like [Phalaenopsis equestris]
MNPSFHPHFSSTTSSSFSPPLPPHQNPAPRSNYQSPCAACKILRRRCAAQCLLAPYFPPTEPLKFTTAHHVFGASNIIKSLQELPESQRADAVSSMVYEATVRIKDPVYGCAGAICYLQKQVEELQAQLARSRAPRAELLAVETQHNHILALFCKDFDFCLPQQPLFDSPSPSAAALNPFEGFGDFLLEDDGHGSIREETVWTS